MIHLLHNWRTEKLAGNFEYRECRTCRKRDIKVVSALPGFLGGIKQNQWLKGEALFTMDERAMQYPHNARMIKYMWDKNEEGVK